MNFNYLARSWAAARPRASNVRSLAVSLAPLLRSLFVEGVNESQRILENLRLLALALGLGLRPLLG